MWAEVSFVLSQITRLTDGGIARDRLHSCSAVKKMRASCSTVKLEASEPYIQAPPLLKVGARRGTGLEQLQVPIGKILALFDKHCRNFAS